MNFNTNIININNKDEFFEISSLIHEITNKNDYTLEKNRIKTKNIKTIYIIIITFFILIYLYYNSCSLYFYNIRLKK